MGNARILLAVWMGLAASSTALAEDADVAAAKAKLHSKRIEERLDAVETLGKLGKAEAAPALEKALSDPEWEIQTLAARALGSLGDEANLPALLKVSATGDVREVRAAAASAVKAIAAASGKPPASLKTVTAHLFAKESAEAIRAADALADLGFATAVESLVKVQAEKESSVRAAVARALGRIGSDKGLARLHTLLRDEAPRVRFESARALGRIAVESSIEPLAKALLGEKLASVRAEMAEALTAVVAKSPAAPAVAKVVPDILKAHRSGKGDERASLAPLLVNLHADGAAHALGERARDTSALVRELAIDACASFADADSLDVIRGALTDSSEAVAIAALRAWLRREPDKRAAIVTAALERSSVGLRTQAIVEAIALGEAGVDLLAPLLADASKEIATSAVASLGRIRSTKGHEPLLKAAKSTDWRVRATACDALARQREKALIPALIEALGDTEVNVRASALKGLRSLAGLGPGETLDAWRQWWAKKEATFAIDSEAIGGAEDQRYGASFYRTSKSDDFDILVVDGSRDHLEWILDDLAIYHAVIHPAELKSTGIHPREVIVVNCLGEIDDEGLARLQWFVRSGGYLVTTDWAIHNTIDKVFPGVITGAAGTPAKGAQGDRDERTVDVEAGCEGCPLLEKVFDTTERLQWWPTQYGIRVIDPLRAEVLLTSVEFEERSGFAPVVVDFAWGHGKVLHLISHFTFQRDGVRGVGKDVERYAFAADWMGIDLRELRRLREAGFFETKQYKDDERRPKVTETWSMFRILTNLLREKKSRDR